MKTKVKEVSFTFDCPKCKKFNVIFVQEGEWNENFFKNLEMVNKDWCVETHFKVCFCDQCGEEVQVEF
jgi:hypothetical protein